MGALGDGENHHDAFDRHTHWVGPTARLSEASIPRCPMLVAMAKVRGRLRAEVGHREGVLLGRGVEAPSKRPA